MHSGSVKAKKFSVRTDLAVEARELAASGSDQVEGVTVETEETAGIHVTTVNILNELGAERMGKPAGLYVTIESEAMKENDADTHEEIIKLLAQKLGGFNKLGHGAALVVGLGNWKVTPDALGPKVVSKVLVTRHMDSRTLPLDYGLRPVCAIAPGVMGLTGIETAEIIRGVAERVNPEVIIAVDALAARKTSRINATVQMSDTGIKPGAGMGGKRMEINEKNMGAPVIAIGVPTVVDAATLVNDTMDKILAEMTGAVRQGSKFYEMLSKLESEDKYNLITEILNPYEENMFVTPKEVDAVIERLSNIIANAVNISLHPGISASDINRFIS
ncbi:MAG: GPR endopeptidase [Clostridiales bacterium]|nr:GPR endopeptidase [Clostridiales bacterium]